MNNRAVTLIELLIYLALLACLSLLAFGFAARTYRFMLERTLAHNHFVRLVVTEDLVRRDLQLASPWPSDWSVVRGDGAKQVFKQLTMTNDGKPVDRWVGYQVDGKGLHRYEGRYDCGAGVWINRTVALVDAQVCSVCVMPISDSQGTAIAVKVELATVGAQARQLVVALRNRVMT